MAGRGSGAKKSVPVNVIIKIAIRKRTKARFIDAPFMSSSQLTIDKDFGLSNITISNLGSQVIIYN